MSNTLSLPMRYAVRWIAAILIGSLALAAYAGPVLSPDSPPPQNSLTVSNTTAGAFRDLYEFHLSADASALFRAHRFELVPNSFTDFHASLRMLSGVLVIEGRDTRISAFGFLNSFYLPELAAGDYQLEISGIDTLGIGYSADLSVYGVDLARLAEIPEPSPLILLPLALLAMGAIRVGRPSGGSRAGAVHS